MVMLQLLLWMVMLQLLLWMVMLQLLLWMVMHQLLLKKSSLRRGVVMTWMKGETRKCRNEVTVDFDVLVYPAFIFCFLFTLPGFVLCFSFKKLVNQCCTL
jgi:hypothetical protein